MVESATDRDLRMICDLLDGRLHGAERTAAFARIDEDEALYETFVETVRFRVAQRAESARLERWRRSESGGTEASGSDSRRGREST
jgi:hypothetical protein